MKSFSQDKRVPLLLLVGALAVIGALLSRNVLVHAQNAAMSGNSKSSPTIDEFVTTFSGPVDFGPAGGTGSTETATPQASIWNFSGTGAFLFSNSAAEINCGQTCSEISLNSNDTGNSASATVNAIPTFSLTQGTVSLDTLVSTTGTSAVGLADGTDENNAIEFSDSGQLTCRTASNGVSTETPVTLPPASQQSLYQYAILAKLGVAKFYINGALVATHTTNIPTKPLNPFFTVSAGPFSGGDVIISTVNFRHKP